MKTENNKADIYTVGDRVKPAKPGELNWYTIGGADPAQKPKKSKSLSVVGAILWLVVFGIYAIAIRLAYNYWQEGDKENVLGLVVMCVIPLPWLVLIYKRRYAIAVIGGIVLVAAACLISSIAAIAAYVAIWAVAALIHKKK